MTSRHIAADFSREDPQMRFSLRISALLAVLLFAFSMVGGTGVGAQDEQVDELQIEDLPGIENGVMRYYTIDYEAMMETASTPGAEFEMPSGLLMLSGMIIEFDNDENASSALDLILQDTTGEDFVGNGEGNVVEEFDIGLGDTSISYFGVEDSEGMSTESAVSFIQQDQYLYVVSAYGSDVDVQDMVTTLASTLVDNDGSGEGEFHEDGTSSSGIWDKFPSSDDELISGLVVSDTVLYPVPEDEDAG